METIGSEILGFKDGYYNWQTSEFQPTTEPPVQHLNINYANSNSSPPSTLETTDWSGTYLERLPVDMLRHIASFLESPNIYSLPNLLHDCLAKYLQMGQDRSQKILYLVTDNERTISGFLSKILGSYLKLHLDDDMIAETESHSRRSWIHYIPYRLCNPAVIKELICRDQWSVRERYHNDVHIQVKWSHVILSGIDPPECDPGFRRRIEMVRISEDDLKIMEEVNRYMSPYYLSKYIQSLMSRTA